MDTAPAGGEPDPLGHPGGRRLHLAVVPSGLASSAEEEIVRTLRAWHRVDVVADARSRGTSALLARLRELAPDRVLVFGADPRSLLAARLAVGGRSVAALDHDDHRRIATGAGGAVARSALVGTRVVTLDHERAGGAARSIDTVLRAAPLGRHATVRIDPEMPVPRRWLLRAKHARSSDIVRQATARWRPPPELLIIGAMKGGTTSLHRLLTAHPQVLGATVKEVSYFTRDHEMAPSYYRAAFPTAAARRLAAGGARTIAVDATPTYLSDPAVPERVAHTLPEVRMVALLRDPVERAWSQFRHDQQRGRLDGSFLDVVRADGNDYVARGCYAMHLQRWFAAFGRDRVRIIASEDFYADPQQVVDDLLVWFGLPPRPLPADLAGQRLMSSGDRDAMPAEARRFLQQRFAAPNADLEDLLGRSFGWQ